MNIHKLIAAITVTGAFASASFAATTNIYNGGYTDLGGHLVVGNGSSYDHTLITNGAVLVSQIAIVGYSASDHDNSVVVTGSGSILTNTGSYFAVGLNGSTNRVSILDGGKIISSGLLSPSYTGGSDNQMLVSGAGSLWQVGSDVYVGRAGGNNSLTISNAGKVTSGTIIVGYLSGSQNNSVLITGNGSIWSSSGYLRVGSNDVSQGSGQVVVENGGTLEVNEIRGGYNGSGQILIRQGGVLQTSVDRPILFTNSSSGIVMSNGVMSYRNVTGADIAWVGTQMPFQGHNTFQLNNASNVVLTSYNFAPGNGLAFQSLRLTNGGFWRSSTLNIGSGGTLSGNGTVASGVATNLGTISPGFSAGVITFTNNLVLGSTSELEMEIGGTNPADYDRLIVGGSLTLAGALDVAPINGFSPAVGNSFTLIDAQAISGQFAGLTNNQFIDASRNGLDAYFQIQYDTANGDVLLLATIPEPSTVLLMAAAGLVLVGRRNRRDSK